MNPVVHPQLGETRKETVSQGGGVVFSLSDGDERSEPESLIQFPLVVLPVVLESTNPAELKGKTLCS